MWNFQNYYWRAYRLSIAAAAEVDATSASLCRTASSSEPRNNGTTMQSVCGEKIEYYSHGFKTD